MYMALLGAGLKTPCFIEARSFEEQAKNVAIKYAMAMAWNFDDIHVGTLDNDTFVAVMA